MSNTSTIRLIRLDDVIETTIAGLTSTAPTKSIVSILPNPQIRLREFSWTFIYPIICLISVCTQSINIAVFVRLTKDRLNKYCLVHSISYFLYTFICAFSFLIRCGSLCNESTSSTYAAKIYEYFIFGYVTSVLAIFSIMIETRLSFERLYILLIYKVILTYKSSQFKGFSNIYCISLF